MPVSHNANPGCHALADRGDDLYETPAVAVRALLTCENLPPVVWEPAAGRGAIARVLMAAGHTVYASDWGCYGFGLGGLDFLHADATPEGCSAIVTNPPYKIANAFVRHAIALCPIVMMLMRLAFLESEGRRDILDESCLARVHVFRNRLPMLHRDGWTGNRNSSSICFAWFVWERGYVGHPTIRRISWEPIQNATIS
jgi:hypothetical protein